MKKNNSQKTQRLVLFSIFAAILVVMSATPLGYLRIGALAISFLTIPVTIGAVLLGPISGATLGLLFGLTSFFQCFGFLFWPIDPLGSALFAINPIYMTIVCIVPRVLMGLLVGLIFKAIRKVDKTDTMSYAVASLSGSVLNTILFISTLLLFFYNTNEIQAYVTQLNAKNVFVFAALFVGINAVFEALVAFIVSFPVTKAVARYSKRFA
ncbi:MAG: ECF transporter S component [Oscillospiraceae bacterium]|nr:ECF transporter S component [Oscillospiraceae bacterium]